MSDIGKIVEDVAGPKSESDAAPLQSSGAGATGAAVARPEGANTRIGRYRWLICALLFFATTVNYVDRLVFGFLGPELMKPEHFGWTAKQLTDIVFWFEGAYAIGLLCAGRFLAWIGARLGCGVWLTV